MFKKLESKIEYSDFSKLIKLSDSIKSSPTDFASFMVQWKFSGLSLCPPHNNSAEQKKRHEVWSL